MQSLIILGRQPKIGLAELESLYGADKLKPIGSQAVLINLHHSEIDFSRLGGMVKFCKVLTNLDTTNWQEIQDYLIENVPKHLDYLPDGKLQLGLSAYNLKTNNKQLLATGLELKKAIKKIGRSVRVIPNDEPALNTAKVLHNHLNGPLGLELVFVKNKSKTTMAQTIAVQDITAYTKRDQARPKRDSKVGMLPPKLAQTIINLSDPYAKTLLDPFCGTGVILQEALLMDKEVYGTDIEPRMVEYSKENLEWLVDQKIYACEPDQKDKSWQLETADATSYSWQLAFDTIASEVYLGRPFSVEPRAQELKDTIQTSNLITKKFLRNLATQTKPGFRLCLAVPTWHITGDIKRLPLLDSLEELGYNRLSFVHASDKDLIYHREGQIVGRELVTFIRK